MNRIYLDHSATTPLDPRVREEMLPYFFDNFGNASSAHWYGRQAKHALENARAAIAQSIGAQPGELFFSSGGTESNNSALRGVVNAAKHKGRNHVVTAATEHHAVLEPCEMLAQEGIDVTILPVDVNGVLSPDLVREALTDKTCLVSIMYANNETGTILPVAEILAPARERGIPVHTDAVQALGKIPVNVDDLGVDLMTITAHKLYGPKGIGALYIRRGVEMDSLLFGGGQERGRRPGTENVPLAVGFAKAVELAVAEMGTEMSRLESLRNHLELRIRSEFPQAVINGSLARRLPHILNISFDSAKIQLEGEMLVLSMDLQGVAVSSGSACTSGSIQPSHVLLAMGRDLKTAKATLRFSFGKSNSTQDVETAASVLKSIVKNHSR